MHTFVSDLVRHALLTAKAERWRILVEAIDGTQEQLRPGRRDRVLVVQLASEAPEPDGKNRDLPRR